MALFEKKKLATTSAPKAAMSSSAPKLAAAPKAMMSAPKTTMSAPKTTMSAPKSTMSTTSAPMDLMDRGKGRKKKGGSSGRSKSRKTGLLGGGCKGLGAMPGGRGRR